MLFGLVNSILLCFNSSIISNKIKLINDVLSTYHIASFVADALSPSFFSWTLSLSFCSPLASSPSLSPFELSPKNFFLQRNLKNTFHTTGNVFGEFSIAHGRVIITPFYLPIIVILKRIEIAKFHHCTIFLRVVLAVGRLHRRRHGGASTRCRDCRRGGSRRQASGA